MTIPSALLCPLWSCTTNILWCSWVCANRKRYGTSFDKRKWLNVDGCGFFTAGMTQFFILGGGLHRLCPHYLALAWTIFCCRYGTYYFILYVLIPRRSQSFKMYVYKPWSSAEGCNAVARRYR